MASLKFEKDLMEVGPAAVWGNLPGSGELPVSSKGMVKAARASWVAKSYTLLMRPVTRTCKVLRRLLFLAIPD